MQPIRFPRFKRSQPTAPFDLTPRGREILRLIYRHRFLRSNHIISLLGGSAQAIQRRLTLLYRHGYLERPRAQLTYYHLPGSRHLVYGLGNKGGALLKQELGDAFTPVLWGEKNQAIGRMFLEHALLVSDVMVAIELACRNHSGVRFVSEAEVDLPVKQKPFQWRVQLNPTLKLGVVPDRVFALDTTRNDGRVERIVFFLEADRGTMPVRRSSLSQTSFYRKLLAYSATWAQALHRRRLGIQRFRVLTVTTSAKRVQSMVDACRELERGQGLFLFADKEILENLAILIDPIWQTGRPDQKASLISIEGINP